MNVKKKARRVMSGLLTAVTVLSTVLSPAVAYASDDAGSVKKIPYYEEIKDQLDEDEVVTAKDYEIKVGDNFDVKSDYTGLTIQDDSKVKVTFQEAKDTDGNDFSTDYANSYKAVYYVEPQTTDHPTYQINRKIVVKEADQQKDSQSESSSDQDAGSSDETETEDSEADSSTEETGAAKTESKTELTEKEFDAEIEATEDQETVDQETGITLSEVMQEAVDQEVALADLEAGESITFDMPMMLASSETGTKSVTVTAGSWYYYADYGLGSYLTCPYYVKWGSINATAYCVEPSKKGPGNGTYTIQKLADGKTLAKVCYYGTKASDENGFFDEKHPDFPAGKRFIITHLAAAYANGSSDWASGTNATGKNLAMELYNYCVNMPDIPSVDMSFSESNVKAYVEGNSQRTSVITFKADKLQTITFKLPSGVKLVNVTNGKTSAAGASVEISGGTQFYLTAPLDQTESVSATFSSRMKGSIDKEYSAYKIVTGSGTQDLALVFGEGVGNEKYVDFKVTWTKECKVSIVKKDRDTGNALAGAVYGIYSDAACTKLIAEMPATDQNGASQLTMEKTQEVVYLKEISVPTGYQIDTKSYNVTLAIGKTTTKNVTDKRVNAKLNIAKQDAETGNEAQGDATLEGAVYGLYAREDIVHPDGRTGTIHKKDSLITSLTTDKNGEASVSDLYLGKYYLKELSAPVGYVLDPTEHDVDCTYEGATVPTVERTSVCKETVIKQPFQIIKAANNGKTDADLLQGVGFSAWLVSDLKVKADGSYDFDSARPVVLTADGQTEMFTDEKGYARSIPLPYGTYVVRETTSKHNYAPVDDFVVKITENHPDTPQTWRVLLDKEFKAKLKIIKKDAETQKSVLLANTEFKVYDLDNQKYVEQTTSYPKPTVHKSYFTNEEGYLVLPKNLKPGNYRIEEVTAPDGYTISKNYVTVAVDTDTAYLTDPATGDAVIDVEYTNAPVKGQLKIYKQGEVLKGFDKDFQYEMAGLAGAEFEVYAAEDIYTADHQVDADGQRTLYFAKDALVATVTTDADGYATVKNLPLGRYYVKEKNAPDTYVLNTVPENVEFAYADQDTAVIEKEISVTDERQKVSITVEKQDAETGNTVDGAVFGIYNAKDIQTKDGKVIVKADTLLQEMTSDEKGQAACTLDLPLGSYYVKELKAPDGFVSSDEVLRFDASYQGQDVQTVTLKSVKKNQPTNVEITKSDATTGVELDGAYLKVTDKDGNVVDSWTSSKDAPHVIKYLKVGETYTLHEEFAPHGYLVANDVTFTVKDTGEVQKVEMKDEVPVGELIINKKGEFLDSVTLADKVKGVVEHIFNYVTGKLTDVTFEVYAEEDIKAADGVSDDYYKKDELIATIKTDETGIAKLENLPLGKYYVKETGTAYGHVLDGEIRHVDLTYVDQNTPVVVYDKDWQNNRQRVEVSVLKKEKDSDRTLEGAIFGLFAKDDIKSETTGKVLIEADEIIELKSTDEEGKITFVADLPIGATYYVKELYAPDGFVTNDEGKEFTFEYAGEDQPTVTYDFTFENQPTIVEFTKSSLTTGKELPGCKLKVVDADGNIVDEWTSGKEAHVIRELTVGKEYTLVETKPADGYVTAESVKFTIKDTADVQKVEMKDDVTKVKISKQDIAGKELPGAKLTILDQDGKVVESWTSTEKAHYIEMLPIGKYTLREETAPDGYLVAKDVEFEVKDTSVVQHVTMVDEEKPAEKTPEGGKPVSDSPKTGDNTNLWLWFMLLGIGATGTGALAMLVERARQISNFQKEKYFNVELDCDGIPAIKPKIFDPDKAEQLRSRCQGSEASISAVKETEKKVKAPKLYDLTTLQREANRIYGMTAKQTLDTAQSLYEKKLITYPRTDSQYLTEDMEQTARNVVRQIYEKYQLTGPFDQPEQPDVKKVMNNSKVTDHHAIIPTMELASCHLDELKSWEEKILFLIAVHTVMAMSKDHIYQETEIEVECQEEIFKAKGKTVLQDGWKLFENCFKNKDRMAIADPDQEMKERMPKVTQGQTFYAVAAEKTEHFTSPPKPYSEDTLLAAMETAGNKEFDEDTEKKGLGTPATRAGIIEKLIYFQYATRKGKKILPTDDGKVLVEILPDFLKSASMTAEWENQLLLMEHGEIAPEQFMTGIKNMLTMMLNGCDAISEEETRRFQTRESIGTCPVCGSLVYESKTNFYCSNHDCHFALWKDNRYLQSMEKTMDKKMAAELLKSGYVHVKDFYSRKKNMYFEADLHMDADETGRVNFSLTFPKKKPKNKSKKK